MIIFYHQFWTRQVNCRHCFKFTLPSVTQQQKHPPLESEPSSRLILIHVLCRFASPSNYAKKASERASAHAGGNDSERAEKTLSPIHPVMTNYTAAIEPWGGVEMLVIIVLAILLRKGREKVEKTHFFMTQISNKESACVCCCLECVVWINCIKFFRKRKAGHGKKVDET